jgi:hypothetical protein
MPKKIISKKPLALDPYPDHKKKGVITTIDFPLTLNEVTDCLYSIGRHGQNSGEALDYLIPLAICINTIQKCLNEGHIDLIEKAARILQGDKKLIAMLRLRETADICSDYLYDRGQDETIYASKASVLQVFALMHPDLKEQIPTSKRQLAEWWKEVDLDYLPQDRGAHNTESVNFWLKELKEDPSRTRSTQR